MENAALDRLTMFERGWLTAFMAIILVATLWFSLTGTTWNDWKSLALNWVVSPVSAITGVLCVLLSAKGKLSNWLWGLVNSLTYGLVAWVSGYYGDWLINWFFFVPTQALIFFTWRRHLVSASTIVIRRHVGWHWIWVTVLTVVAIGGLAVFLTSVDNFFTSALKRSSAFYDNLHKLTGLALFGPVLDSSTVVFQVAAQMLMAFRYAEQWPFWLLTNVVTIAIWTIVVITDPSSWPYSIPTLAMWVAFLVNSIYGTIRWFSPQRAMA